MGLYDNFYIPKKFLLPLPKDVQDYITNETDWQTKDLECFLIDYHVDNEGSLTVNNGWTSDGWVETKKKSDYTGVIKFYSNFGDKEDRYKIWVEFIAYFTKGKFQEILNVKIE